MKVLSDNLNIIIRFVSNLRQDYLRLAEYLTEKEEFSRLAQISSSFIQGYQKNLESYQQLAEEIDLNYARCKTAVDWVITEIRTFCLELSVFIEKEVEIIEGFAVTGSKKFNKDIEDFTWIEDESSKTEKSILRFTCKNKLETEAFDWDSECSLSNCDDFLHFFKVFSLYAGILARCKQILRVVNILGISIEKNFAIVDKIIKILAESHRNDEVLNKIEDKIQILEKFDKKFRKAFNKINEFSKNSLIGIESCLSISCFKINLLNIRVFLGERLKNVLNSCKIWMEKLGLFNKSENQSPRKLSIDSQPPSSFHTKPIFHYFHIKTNCDLKLPKDKLIQYTKSLINAVALKPSPKSNEFKEMLNNSIYFFDIYHDTGIDFVKSVELKANSKVRMLKEFRSKYFVTVKEIIPKRDKFKYYQKAINRASSTQRINKISESALTNSDHKSSLSKITEKNFSLIRSKSNEKSIKSNEKLTNRLNNYTQNLTSRLSGRFLCPSHIRKIKDKDVYLISLR